MDTTKEEPEFTSYIESEKHHVGVSSASMRQTDVMLVLRRNWVALQVCSKGIGQGLFFCDDKQLMKTYGRRNARMEVNGAPGLLNRIDCDDMCPFGGIYLNMHARGEHLECHGISPIQMAM